MKPTSLLLISLSLCVAAVVRGQDAATEERLNRLSGQVEDLIAAQKEQKNRFAAIIREIESLREQLVKPSGQYASQDEVKRLADSIKDVDRKRMEDNEKIGSELLKLRKLLAAPMPGPRKPEKTPPADNGVTEKAPLPEKGFEYTIQKNDTLSVIVQAYRDKNIKVTIDQILKANPGLKANQMRVGQKIFIPAPAGAKTEG